MICRNQSVVCLCAILAIALGPRVACRAAESNEPHAPAARWANGPGGSESFFPLAVWLQSPANAARYRAIGINLYVGLWQGPTAEQLQELERHGMPVICDQNAFARTQLDRKILVGWMHGDEPDNAQSLGEGRGYGPPVAPQTIVADYERIKACDPSRPVLLNLGQGVAWDGWYGRGVRTNHPEDYPQYVPGGDIVSFDIYPAVHDRPEVAGKLWYVARGVRRLRQWAGPQRLVWNCIECTRIGNPETRPTPQQVKAEVWMSIIHGSQGIIYFCHQFAPQFLEAGLLADEQLAQAVGAINRQVSELAPVLSGPTIDGQMTVEADPAIVSEDLAAGLPAQPIAVMLKQHAGALYLFAVRMEATPCRGRFQIPGIAAGSPVEVIGENRQLVSGPAGFVDQFAAHEVHLYRIPRGSRLTSKRGSIPMKPVDTGGSSRQSGTAGCRHGDATDDHGGNVPTGAVRVLRGDSARAGRSTADVASQRAVGQFQTAGAR